MLATAFACALQVFASGTGNRRHPLFFLDGLRKRLSNKQQPRQPRTSSELQLPTIKSANGSTVNLTADASAAAAAAAVGGVPPAEEPEDVAAERLRVELIGDYQNNPIAVRHLNKTYPGLDGQPPKVGWFFASGCMTECVFASLFCWQLLPAAVSAVAICRKTCTLLLLLCLPMCIESAFFCTPPSQTMLITCACLLHSWLCGR